MADNGDTDRGDPTWVRLQLPGDTHNALRERARAEGRGITDFVTSLLVDTVAGNFGMGEPAKSESAADADPYTVKKPSEQPLSVYARDAQQLILVGTTLRSIQPFMESFLWPKAKEGARLTFLLVDEEMFKSERVLLEQVALRHGSSATDTLEQLSRTTEALEALQNAHRTNVSVLKLRVLPSFGLTIVDPFALSAQMRISLYLYQPLTDCNLALHIQPSTAESRHIFGAFVAHYERLVVEAGRSLVGAS